MNAKTLWESKTFWFNILGLLATVAAAFGLDLGLSDEVKAQIVGGVMAVGNIVLRLVTSKPVKL